MNHSLRMHNIAFLVVVLFSCSIALKKSNIPLSQKLDFRLKLILDAEKSKTPTIESVDRNIISEQNAEGVLVFPCFIYADGFEQIRSSGIQLQSVIKTFATARLTTAELELLSTLASVKYVAPTTIDYPHNDVARALIGADLLHSGYVNSTQFTGSGVIIGIIDTGIDWRHLDFRDPIDSSKSRILYIWDQTIIAQGSESTPTNFSYGVEYTQVNINNELDGSSAGFVRENDTYGHGTHVAGTAAGNGSSLATKKYKGMAPNADLIIVKAGNGSFPNTNLIDAISYLNEKATAEGKPLVINMSLGSDAGPHDGTDTKGLAVANFSGPGRIVVMSAGNSGGTPIHFSGIIGANSSSSVTFTVPAYTVASGASNDNFAFDLWLQDGSNVNAQITTPNGYMATQNSNSSGFALTNDGYVSIYNFNDANNGDREIFCTINDQDASKPPATGTWTLQLTNTTGSALTYHGWLYDYTIGSNAKTVAVTGGNANYTVSNASDSAVIVGSLASRWRWYASDGSAYMVGTPNGSDSISSFSSRGPSRSGATKPDIAAPGQQVISSRSTGATFSAAEIVGGLQHVCMQGTSMASPVVAGSVALLLQQNSTLTVAGIKSLIASTATTDSYAGSVPNNTWGYGKLDIVRSVIKAINPSFVNQRNILAYDEWVSDATSLTLINKKIAVKFSPVSNGKVVGAFFHPSSFVSLTTPLYAEVWSDNGSGLPGSKIGSTVSYDYNAILPMSWNHIDMTGANASVATGNNYHIVLNCTSGTDFRMLYDTGNKDGRSSYNSGGLWATYASGDYRIRPVIMTDISALPVELYAFTATVHNNDVQLEWSTASELNDYGFEIEKKRVKDELGSMNWEKIGFVEGSGTTNTPKAYSFVDARLNDVAGQASASGKISYRLKQIDRDGKFSYSQEVEVMISQIPKIFALMQNYPNPFNPSTVISFQLPLKSLVTLKVYDILGREVATIVNEVIEAGSYNVQFDGSKLSSGIYFYTLNAGEFSATKKLSLIK
jgi:minor extracellular serine protease Vpr